MGEPINMFHGNANARLVLQEFKAQRGPFLWNAGLGWNDRLQAVHRIDFSFDFGRPESCPGQRHPCRVAQELPCWEPLATEPFIESLDESFGPKIASVQNLEASEALAESVERLLPRSSLFFGTLP